MTSPSTDIDERFQLAARGLLADAPEALGRFSREGVHADLFLTATSNSVVDRRRSRHAQIDWSGSDSEDFSAALNVVSGTDAFLGVFDPLRNHAIDGALRAAASLIAGIDGSVDFDPPFPEPAVEDFSPESARGCIELLGDALSDILDPDSLRISFDSRIRRRLIIANSGRAEATRDVTNRVIVKGRASFAGIPGEVRHIADPGDFDDPGGIADAINGKVREIGDVRPLGPGISSVIMKAGWAGTWIHEIVGHMLEADVFFDGPFRTMLGSTVAPPFFTVLDGPGDRLLDDEGSPTKTSVLIEGGVLTGLMADQRAAHRYGLAPSGNGFRSTAGKPPLPRMTSIRLESGASSVDELVAMMKDGVVIDDFRSATILPDGTVRIHGASGQRIESGRLSHRVSGLCLHGSATTWLGGIRGVAADAEVEKTRGMCLKAGQPHRVITIAPSTLIAGISIEQT